MTLHGGAWAIEKLKVPAIKIKNKKITKHKQQKYTKKPQTKPQNMVFVSGQYLVTSQNYYFCKYQLLSLHLATCAWRKSSQRRW